jgi:hypothetical protein
MSGCQVLQAADLGNLGATVLMESPQWDALRTRLRHEKMRINWRSRSWKIFCP